MYDNINLENVANANQQTSSMHFAQSGANSSSNKYSSPKTGGMMFGQHQLGQHSSSMVSNHQQMQQHAQYQQF